MSWLNFAGLDRFSPFTRRPPPGSATVSDADFSYITSEDLRKHVPADQIVEGDRDTDILRIREGRHSHNIHFPAYSITRGELTVGDVRDAVAKKLDVKRRNIDLHYKARKMSDDAQRCLDLGLQDGSELLCSIEDSQSPSDTESEDEGASGSRPSTKKKRKSRSSRNKRKKQNVPPPVTSDNLHAASPQSRGPSPAKPIDPLKMGTTQEKLTALFAVLRSFENDVQAFLKHPPSEASKREFEYKRLSETILTQVLLKTDAVETEGDADARSRRKELVKKTQDMLRSLDEANSKS